MIKFYLVGFLQTVKNSSEMHGFQILNGMVFYQKITILLYAGNISLLIVLCEIFMQSLQTEVGKKYIK